jgi:ABC-type uncharacterized transport system permease subunit
MFPLWLQRISLWLPFRFITNAPAQIFIHFNLKKCVVLVTGQLLYIVLTVCILFGVWRAAQHRIVVHGG